jgi:hypothetical protein
VRDHWARTDDLWPPGGTREAWLVTFEELPEVAELARRAAAALDLPHLDVVPLPWLHLTLAGPVDHAVTARFLPPRPVDEGIVLDVEDDGTLGPWPHVSLAYANGDGEPPRLDRLALEPVTATIAAVSRVRMRREPRLYAWDVLERVPLRDSK